MNHPCHILGIDFDLDGFKDHRLVALIDGGAELAGVASLRGLGQPAVTLFQLFVAEPYQRCGIGRALVHHGLEMVAEAGGKYLSAVVTKGGPVEFYEKLGFVPVHYENNQVLMARQINRE